MLTEIVTIQIEGLPGDYALVPISLTKEMKLAIELAQVTNETPEHLWEDILRFAPIVVPKLKLPKDEKPKK